MKRKIWSQKKSPQQFLLFSFPKLPSYYPIFSFLSPKRIKKLGYLPTPIKTLRPLSSMQM